ncbi:MAG: hypothetical protein RL373_1728 [Pseudomonadota bacterium]|jgi:molybdate transport system substrate-binding protein|nr:ABC transporter substrate-binding protein [Betaproteobacteria bacterium]
MKNYQQVLFRIYLILNIMIPISLAHSAEIQVLASTGMYSLLHEMIPSYETKSGNKLIVSYDTSNIVLNRVKSGESSDLIILTGAAIDDLIKQGKVAQIGRTNIAQSGIGVAIKTGSVVPNISTPEALKATLLQAKSISFTATGASGIYFSGVLEKLGIQEELKTKIKNPQGGHIAKLVANGEAEIGVQMTSELKGVPGAQYVGPLPPPLQMLTVFTGGIFSNAKEAKISQEFLQFITDVRFKDRYEKIGLEMVK